MQRCSASSPAAIRCNIIFYRFIYSTLPYSRRVRLSHSSSIRLFSFLFSLFSSLLGSFSYCDWRSSARPPPVFPQRRKSLPPERRRQRARQIRILDTTFAVFPPFLFRVSFVERTLSLSFLRSSFASRSPGFILFVDTLAAAAPFSRKRR